MKIARVAVLGAGPMGRALAYCAAQAGFATILQDMVPSRFRADALAEELAEQQATAHLCYGESIEEAVREADLVLDTVPDELESKLEIVTLIDRMAPPATIIATPTTALSIGDLASCTYRAERCVGLNLPPLAELERMRSAQSADSESADRPHLPITLTTQTRPEVAAAVTAFCTALGFRVTTELDPWQQD